MPARFRSLRWAVSSLRWVAWFIFILGGGAGLTVLGAAFFSTSLGAVGVLFGGPSGAIAAGVILLFTVVVFGMVYGTASLVDVFLDIETRTRAICRETRHAEDPDDKGKR